MVLSVAGQVSAVALVGVDFGRRQSPQITPVNWTFMPTSGRGNPVVMSNLIDEDGVPTMFSLSVADRGGNTLNEAQTFAADQIPAHTNALAGLDGNAWNVGDTEVVWRGLHRFGRYDLWVFTGDLFPLSQSVTIAGAGALIVYRESIAGGTLAINGQLGSSTNALDRYALRLNADGAGQITIDLDGDTVSAIAATAIRRVVPEPAAGLLTLLSLATLVGRRGRGPSRAC